MLFNHNDNHKCVNKKAFSLGNKEMRKKWDGDYALKVDTNGTMVVLARMQCVQMEEERFITYNHVLESVFGQPAV